MRDISEVMKDFRKADKEDRERAELFKAMINSPGWKAYIGVLEAKIQSYSEQLLAPSGGLDGMVASEWVKGAMSGLIMARDVVSVTIAAIEELRRVGLAGVDDDNTSSVDE